MIIKIGRQEFDTLPDMALPFACFEPIIPMIRAKDITIKEDVYNQLTREQKVLFMFNAYYNHASKSLAEFYWWSAYYLAQPKAWSEIKSALKYFKADAMMQILLEMESILEVNTYPEKSEKLSFSYNDLDNDPKLHTSICQLYTKFNKISPLTLKTIGQIIRKKPNDFILFTD